MLKKYKKTGFTMSEVLVTLVVIGVIVSILFPLIKKVIPDRNEKMHIKLKGIISRVTNELVSDNDLYPGTDEHINFADQSDAVYDGVTYTGDSKFCKLFIIKLNGKELTNACENATEWDFQTNDGMVWNLPVVEFPDKGYVPITVDTSGGTSNVAKTTDRFTFYVLADGRVLPNTPDIKDTNDIEDPPCPDGVCPGGGGDDTPTSCAYSTYCSEQATAYCTSCAAGCSDSVCTGNCMSVAGCTVPVCLITFCPIWSAANGITTCP